MTSRRATAPAPAGMDSSSTLFERLARCRDDLSPGQRRVATYLVEHYREAAFLLAAEVAAAVGVSESLVVRFASALGYSGYPALTRDLQALVKARLSLPERLQQRPVELAASTPVAEVWQAVAAQDQANLADTLADPTSAAIADVLDALIRARTIYLVGLRGSAHLAGLFGLLLEKAGAPVRVITCGDVTMFDRLRHIGPDDVLLAFAFARYTVRTVEALRLARGASAVTVVVSDSPIAPAVAEAHHRLNVRVASAAFHHSYTAAVSMLNALVVAWTLRAPERTMDSLEALEGVLPLDDFLS